MTRRTSLLTTFAGLLGLSLACIETSRAQDLLDNRSESLTTYRPNAGTPIQGARPIVLQRGVNIDGTERADTAFDWAVAANPFPEAWNANDRFADIQLVTGAYSPLALDLSIHSDGIPWVVGRTYNARQQDGSGSYSNDSYQGWNWFQTSQPELIFVDSEVDSSDMIVLMYGADRFLEFYRVMSESTPTNTFRGVNGAAGAIVFAADSSGPDTYAYYDQHGTQVAFFGFDTQSGVAQGQLWKMTDPMGHVTYVGDATTKSTAISNGYDSAGRVLKAYDASGNRYSYTYSAVDSLTRLTQVKAERQISSTWTEVGRVDYAYYHASGDPDNDHGLSGDLKLVTVTTPLSDTSKSIQKKTYYRYYGRSSYNNDTNSSSYHPGYAHQIKMVVHPEGLRRFDWAEDGNSGTKTLDDSFLSKTDATLNPYAMAFFTYEQTTHRVASAWFNGECGCSGGSSGVYKFRYEVNSSYTDTSGYQNTWCQRVVVLPPVYFTGSDVQRKTVVTQYFDEIGQPLSRVESDGDIANGSTSYKEYWPKLVDRDATTGVITQEHPPKNVQTYTHSTGELAALTTRGLIRQYDRVSSGQLKGLLAGRSWKAGSSSSAVKEWEAGYTTASLAVSSEYTMIRPLVSWKRTYPDTTGSTYNQTDFTYGMHSGSAALMPKSIQTQAPVVSTANNGLGGTTRDTSIQYLRADGTLAFSLTPDGIYNYQAVSRNRVTKVVRDISSSSTEIASGDSPSNWSLSTFSGVFELQAKTTYSYDEQGRLTDTVLPSGRTQRLYYAKLDDERGVTFSIARVPSSGTAFGPVGYTVFNSQNRAEAEARIALPSEQTTVALSSWIVSSPSSPVDDPILALSSSVGSIKRLTTHGYNKPGTRETEKRVYSNVPTQINSAGVEDYGATTYEYDALGRMYRVRYPGYDTLGRSDGVTDPSRTFVRTIFNPRGKPIDRIIGTVDSDGSSFATPNGRSPGEIVWCGSGSEGDGGPTVSSVDGGGTGEGDDAAGSWCCGSYFVCEGADGQEACCAVDLSPDPTRPWNRAYYDFRGRLTVLIRQDRPSVLYKRDNLGRVIAVGLYSSLSDAVTVSSGRFQFEIDPGAYDPMVLNTSTCRRLALMTYSYDEQDRNWKQTKYAVEPPESSTAGEISTTDASKQFESVSWFDASDRIVKARGDSLVKYKYDRLGRLTNEFFLSRDNDSGYTDAFDVAGDTVLRERQTAYEAATGNVLMTVSIDRFHDDNASRSSPTATALDLNSDTDLKIVTASDIKGRVSIQARWYDTLDRVRTIADYGTNGGATFNRTSTSEPTASSSSVVLVWKYTYDTVGTLQDVNDASGHITRTLYDHAGQVTSRIENYVDGTPGPSDQDRVTQYVYTHGLLAKYIVKVPSASDQVTEYYYGTSLAVSGPGSGLATGHLLWKIKYPDSSGSTDLVTLEYNRTGKVIRTSDQAGNLVHFGYDSAKRLRFKEAYSVTSGFVDDIHLEQYAYNVQGLLSSARQLDSLNSVMNESTFLYDAWWNLKTLRQDVDSAVDAGTGLGSYDTSFSYAKVGSSNTRQAIRRTGITYPDSYQVDFDYLVSTGSGNDPTSEVANDVSRVYRVKAGPSGVPVAKYDYIGIDGLVGVEYPEATITSARYGSTYGSYPSLDQFDRLVSDTWVKGGASSPNVLSAVLTYDASSNVKSITDGILSGQDALFTIDNLDRLTRAQEGTLSSGSITSPKRDEQWTLSQPGNWAEHKLDKNGDTSYTGLGDIQETAQFNTANEFNGSSSRSITTGTGGSTSTQSLSPTFDAVGNLTDDGKDYVFKYDVLGRLRKVYKHSAPTQLVAEFGYDALNHLISAKYDTDNDGSMSDEVTERYVYDSSWRIIAIYVTNAAGTSTTLQERYIRHHAGIDGFDGSSAVDAIILRDRNANTSSSDLEERRYYCQNWHGDVSAITDEGGNVLERVKYSAYGVPRAYPVVNPDIDDGSGTGTPDGGVTIDDLLLYLEWFEDGDIRADVDDGTGTGIKDSGVTIDDLLMYQAAFDRGELPAERLSGGTGNRFGYGGYLWDSHLNLYHVRHRAYDPFAGRFISRDPTGYVSGASSLYEYVSGAPVELIDSLGLGPEPTVPTDRGPNRAPYDLYPGISPDKIVELQNPHLKPNPKDPYGVDRTCNKGPDACIRDKVKEDNPDFGPKVDVAENAAQTFVEIYPILASCVNITCGGANWAEMGGGGVAKSPTPGAAPPVRKPSAPKTREPVTPPPSKGEPPSGLPGGKPPKSVYPDGTPVYDSPPRLGGDPREPGVAPMENPLHEGPPAPIRDRPYSKVRWDSKNGRVYQLRTYDQNGKPVCDVDMTTPISPNGTPRPGHVTAPEVHPWQPNPTGGTPARGPGVPARDYFPPK